MLFFVIFLYCIGIATANFDIFNNLLNDFTLLDGNRTSYSRFQRSTPKLRDFTAPHKTCDQMERTSRTPFVVLLLYRSSGRFLGMASLIDPATVLTAGKVVQSFVKRPNELLILAHRLGPWWGKNSQVRKATDVHLNDGDLALLNLDKPFILSKYVSPIRVAKVLEKEFVDAYTRSVVVFGVPRSSWDIPGEETPKSSIYVMQIETYLIKKEDNDACKASFPETDFNDTVNFCTTANGTFCWGCLGSPTVGVTTDGKVQQIGVITSSTTSEADVYHIHTLIAPFEQWIRSQSDTNYIDMPE